jgi:hypothetical protein
MGEKKYCDFHTTGECSASRRSWTNIGDVLINRPINYVMQGHSGFTLAGIVVYLFHKIFTYVRRKRRGEKVNEFVFVIFPYRLIPGKCWCVKIYNY